MHPLIQAPMVGVSTPALAAAVSNAGALGSIGIGACDVNRARQMIEDTKALTEAPFNVNLFCHRPACADPEREAAWLGYLTPFFTEFGAAPPTRIEAAYRSFIEQPDMLKLLLEAKPAVVSFHFGLPPQDWVTRLRQAGITTLGCATSPEEAGLVADIGCDAVIAQGHEAGGHRGTFDPIRSDAGIDTLSLVRTLASSASMPPLIAAGGIMSGEDIHRALASGAAAAQLGTAFVLCPESSANAGYRERLTSGRSLETGITSVISGRPARGIVNRLHRDVDRPGTPATPDYPIAYQAGKALAAAAGKDSGFAAHWAGTGAARARAMPAAELVETLVAELRRCR